MCTWVPGLIDAYDYVFIYIILNMSFVLSYFDPAILFGELVI